MSTRMRPLGAWPTALRLARRDAVRARGRSLLVLVMIAPPVLAATAADVVYATEKVSGAESLDRRLGTAEARLVVQPGMGPVIQGFDPDTGIGSVGGGKSPAVGLADIVRILGHPVTATLTRTGETRVTTDAGAVQAQSTELDLRNPLTPLGSLALDAPKNMHTWYVGCGPVTWDQVLALNRVGVTVLSRHVLEHPPSDSMLPADVRDMATQNNAQLMQVATLVVVMALLELVLLPGPAFAVSARRHSRTLVLMAASGGTPRQSRRVILASGVVLGGAAAWQARSSASVRRTP